MLMMFARVLFPTDFSGYANAVFACLLELKEAGMREVVLVHVIRTSDVPLPETLNRKSMEYVRWSAQEQLNIAKMALEAEGLRVSVRVEYGSPPALVVRVAEEEQVDLIVIGAQGATVAQELLVGSVSYEVVRRATVPVLIHKFDVVRELGHVQCNRVCEQMFTRVLHPTDFTECADAAFQVMKRLRTAGTQEVVVLHVQDERAMKHRPAQHLEEFDREDTERLEEMCRALLLYGLQARPLLRRGVPSEEALKVAREMNASLIVLGSRGSTVIQDLIAGSTFENVVRLSRQPVLVVRG